MHYGLFQCADRVCFLMAVRHISVGTPGSLTPTVKSSSSQNNYLTVSTFTCRKKQNQTCLLTPGERVTKEPHAQARPKGGSVEFYNGARRPDENLFIQFELQVCFTAICPEESHRRHTMSGN